MVTISATTNVVKDIMDNAEERELWIVSKEMERPPYWFAEEGMNARLIKALRVVQEDRITPNSDGSYTVEVSEHRQYRVTDSCSCPQSQKGKSKWCYHAVSVALYVEWRKRCAPTPPIVLGTLRAGTAPLPTVQDDDDTLGNGYPVDDETLPLPLPQTTVDERLASRSQEPLGARMSEDAPEYIPEPDNGPVAILEPSRAIATRSREAQALVDAMTAWKEQRQLVTQYIKEQMQAGIDYYQLKVQGRDTKPTLSKAGSEKFLHLMRLVASFEQDAATWQMLGSKEGLLCYTCRLTTREGQIVGEGRGARTIQQDKGDINKAVKMAQKSAMIDAILRTGCLSDVFTQDYGEPEETAPVTPARPWMESQGRPSSSELRQRIWALVKAADGTITSREACETYVQRVTGLALEPNNYGAIVDKLGGQYSP